jgi:hypothetical protein
MAASMPLAAILKQQKTESTMKYTASDIDSYMETFGEDEATFGAAAIEVIFKRSFVLVDVGGSQVEARAWNVLARSSDLDDLATPVVHGDTVTVRSQNYTVTGVQTDDPMEGITRLILAEA